MSNITDNMVLFLPMETVEGNTLPDESGYSNNFSLFNSPSLVADPVFGNALLFNGGNQYGQAGYTNLNGLFSSGNDQFSFTGWLKISELRDQFGTDTDSTPNNFLLSKNSSINFNISLGIGTDGSIQTKFYFRDGVYSANLGSGSLTPGSWIFIALTLDAGQLSYYVNGGSNPFSYTFSAQHPEFISESYPIWLGGDPDTTNYYNGACSHFRIYNRALSAEDVNDIMHTDLSSQLLAHFPLTEIVNSNQVLDVSGNNYSGTTSGGPTLIPDVDFGSCISFDSSYSQKITPTLEFSQPGDLDAMTAEVWFQTSQSETVMSLISYDPDDYFSLTIGNSTDGGTNTISFQTRDVNGVSNNLNGITNVVTGTWVHVAVTYSASTGNKQIYINGELDSEGIGHVAGSALGYTGTSGHFAVQHVESTYSAYFDGQMSNIRLYSEARTKEQILFDMVADQNALSSYYKFYPIAFEITEEDEENVIYIYDEPNGHVMNVNIWNTSDRVIELPPIPEVSEVDYHFALAFRPNTLSDQALQSMVLEDSGSWNTYGPVTLADQTQVIYLASPSGMNINPGEVINLRFDNVSADPSGGSRGTRVELGFNNMHYTGEVSNLIGDRIIQVGIVNHAGLKEIPLYAGFTGSDLVLIGDSNNLTLRLTNILPVDAANPNANKLAFSGQYSDTPTTFTFRMVVDGDGTEEWALVAAANTSAITVVGYGGSSSGWTANNQSESEPYLWSLIPNEDFELAPGEYFDLTLYGIIPEAPSSHCNLYLDYINVPGYWDGTFVKDVVKGPVSMNDTSIGIGTTEISDKITVEDGSITLRNTDGGNHGLTMQNASQQYGWRMFQDGSNRLNFNYSGSTSSSNSGNNYLQIDSSNQSLTIPGSGGIISGGHLRINSGGLEIGQGDANVENGNLTVQSGKIGVGNAVSSQQEDILVNGGDMGVVAQNDSNPVGFAFRKSNGNAGWYLWQSNGSFGISGGSASSPSSLTQHLKLDTSGNLDIKGTNNALTLDARDNGVNLSTGQIRVIGAQPTGSSNNVTKLDFENQYYPTDSDAIVYTSIRTRTKSGNKGDLRFYARTASGLVHQVSINDEGLDLSGGSFRIQEQIPIQFKRYEIPGHDTSYDTGILVNDFSAGITGFAALDGDIQENGTHDIIQIYMYKEQHSTGETWAIKCKFITHNNSANWWVDVMFVRREMSSMDNFDTIPSH